jgi:hypothetical protein
VIKLYEPSPALCLYVAMAENMVGRAPLIPMFMAGNSTPGPTIPHMFSKRKDLRFPYGCADSAAADGRRGTMSTRLAPGCGSLGMASPAWVV